MRNFYVGTPKTTQTGNRNPQNRELRYPCSTSHIRWNNLILTESVHNSFFFPHTSNLSACQKLWRFNLISEKRLCHLWWHSLQTNRVFSNVGPLHEWWLLCTKPKLQLSVLKVVGTHNFDEKKSDKVAENSTFCVEMTKLIR